jgi:hypothetical protein
MHISQLSIFSKDTDATEAIRGYKFQELKTLETWLHSRVHKNDQRIYCDYEQDIFERDLSDYKAKFRQIKLYTSKTFSFSSIEITKAFVQFFLLYIKGEYIFDDVSFGFETNTGVAREYAGNDAALLRQWVESVKPIEGELLIHCVDKAKQIIETELVKRAKDVPSELSENAKKALELLGELDDAFWQGFVKSIEWEFTNTAATDALNRVIESIHELISQLPFPISQEDAGIAFAALYTEIGKKSIAEKPEQRYVDNALLDHVLLNLGDNDDRGYAEAYAAWKDVKEINGFTIGEFYAVLHATKICRRKPYLEEHSALWATLLAHYIVIENIPVQCKRDAIYELVFIRLRPSLDLKKLGALDGVEPIVEEYFKDFEKFTGHNDISDAHNLFTIVYTSQLLGLLKTEKASTEDWQKRFTDFIALELAEAKTAERKCRVLEISAFHKLNQRTWKIAEHSLTDVVSELEKIIPLLQDAPMYPISQLSQKIEGLLPAFGMVKKKAEIQTFEDFLDKIEPLVSQRDGNFALAKKYIRRGADYINTTDPKKYLVALAYFHKAKVFYYEDAAMEGFVLALLNLSQFYLATGVHFAAKYYALLAAWVSFNDGKTELYARISKAYGFIHIADYTDGAWINSLQSFGMYLQARTEFNIEPLDIEEDETLRESVMMGATVISVLQIFPPGLEKIPNEFKDNLGWFYESHVKYMEEFLLKDLTEEKAKLIAIRKTSGIPLNDIGKKRAIAWKALGVEWTFSLPNDYIHNSLAEEFCALLQVFQVEVSLSEMELSCKVKKVNVEIAKSTLIIPPDLQLIAPDELKVKLYLQELKASDSQDIIKLHYVSMTSSIFSMFREVSSLKEKEIQKLILKLMENQKTADKGLSIASYQKVYTQLIRQDMFEAFEREKFSSEVIVRTLPIIPGLV